MSLLVQVRVLLLALLGVIVYEIFPVTFELPRLTVRLLNVSPVTSCLTVTVQVLLILLPSVVFAVIVTLPGAFPVMFPELSTVAIFVSLLVQVRVLLLALLGVIVYVIFPVTFELPRFSVRLFNVRPVTY